MKSKFYSLKILLILIVVFILQITIRGFTELFILNSIALTDLQIWRFLTAIFLHGSLTHLLFNIFALFFFGLFLEKDVGSDKFLLIFISSGILANLISVNFYEASLGASGAIYGVIGALVIIRPLMMVWTFGLIMPLFIAAFLWVTADILRTLGAFGPTNIGSIAHLSGIFIGLILGFVFRSSAKA